MDVLPLWCIFPLVGVSTWLAMDAGFRLGRRRCAMAVEERESAVSAMVGSILALLAFMLAFTFSLAATRFEARRETVLDEANAIGTTYLRARFLPDPQRTAVMSGLREYVDVRIRAVEGGAMEEGIKRSEEIQERIWAQTVVLAQKYENPVMTSLFIQSLNEMIDLHSKRLLVGMRSRIPPSIWLALVALALLGMGALGYQAGLSATRRSPVRVGIILAFALVLYLIADLDRSHGGLLRVSQQAMLDLQRTMQSTS